MAVAGWRGANAADLLSAEWFNLSKPLTDEGDKALARYMAYAATLEQALQLLHDPDLKIRAAMGFYRSGYKDDPSERARWEATLHGGTYRCDIIWPNFQEAPKTVMESRGTVKLAESGQSPVDGAPGTASPSLN